MISQSIRSKNNMKNFYIPVKLCFKRLQKRKGFTLVELLTVISIVSLLSSIIFASISSSKTKAKLGAARSLYASAYHKMVSETILSLNFNESSGSVKPVDSTGNFDTANIPVSHISDSPLSDAGYSFNVGGTGAGVLMSRTTGDLNLGTTISGFSVSIWVKALSTPSISYLYGATITGDTTTFYPYVYVTSTAARCVFGSALGGATLNLADNQWHHILCDYNRINNTLSMYVDGNLGAGPGAVVATYSTVNTFKFTSVYVGANSSGASAFTIGYIDNFQIFADSFTAMEAYRLYAEGAARHGIALR